MTLVRGAGLLGRPRRAAAAPRPRPGRAGHRGRRVRATTPADFREPRGGCVDCLQADVTRCGGITGLLSAAGLANAHGLDVSGPLRAGDLGARALRRAERCGTSSTSTTTSGSSGCSSTAFLEPEDGALRPDRSRPGYGLELKRADAERFSAQVAEVTTLEPRDAAERKTSTVEASPATCAPRSRARSASTPAAAPSTRPTARTTGRCRSASSIPRDVDDVVATIAVCREHGAPILPRGGGTSLAGQCCNVAVVIDFSKYLNRILEIDPERRARARRSRACVLDHLRDAAEREARADLRARPVDARPLHARRHDRQQLLRRPLGAWREFYGPGPRVVGQRRASSRC